ncbi:MAG TPA: ribosome-associated translation inhibitor RaiA, partial [Actinobacteria bacterium]|nr:ribosome-associated translation inhibitor RaiA [Actinomycetota bacterium]
MEYVIKGKNTGLDDKIKDYSEKKIKARIEKLMDKTIRTEVKFKLEKNPRISDNKEIEITVFASGAVIRVTDAGTDFFEIIDRASHKLERQINKYREKLRAKGRKSHIAEIIPGEITEPVVKESRKVEDKIRQSIVKTKTFLLKPIPPEEAVIQMELIEHDFFVFINSETGRTAVVYRR